MCVPGRISVSVLVCLTHALPVYPTISRHHGLPVVGKYSGFNFIHRHVRRSCWCRQSGNLRVQQPPTQSRRGRVKITLSNILNLDCNSTYSTFKWIVHPIKKIHFAVNLGTPRSSKMKVICLIGITVKKMCFLVIHKIYKSTAIVTLRLKKAYRGSVPCSRVSPQS